MRGVDGRVRGYIDKPTAGWISLVHHAEGWHWAEPAADWSAWLPGQPPAANVAVDGVSDAVNATARSDRPMQLTELEGGTSTDSAMPSARTVSDDCKPPSQHAPQQAPQKKQSPAAVVDRRLDGWINQRSLVLTIRRAVGLAAMDSDGSSDPYVVLKIGEHEAQRTSQRSLGLTSVVDNSVDPVWDESFSIAIDAAVLDRHVVLQVWDKDTLTRDDFMGGIGLGTVRQLLSKHGGRMDGTRLSLRERLMPRANKRNKPVQGELHIDLELRPVDFVSGDAAGMLSITVQRAVSLAAKDGGGTSDPYVLLIVGKQPPQQTAVASKTLNPAWQQRFEALSSMDEAVVLQVWDKDRLTADDFMGEARLGTVQQLLSTHGTALARGIVLRSKLVPRGGDKTRDVQGELFVHLQLKHPMEGVAPMSGEPTRLQQTEDGRQGVEQKHMVAGATARQTAARIEQPRAECKGPSAQDMYKALQTRDDGQESDESAEAMVAAQQRTVVTTMRAAELKVARAMDSTPDGTPQRDEGAMLDMYAAYGVQRGASYAASSHGKQLAADVGVVNAWARNIAGQPTQAGMAALQADELPMLEDVAPTLLPKPAPSASHVGQFD